MKKIEGTETEYLAEYLITRNGDIRKLTGRIRLLRIYIYINVTSSNHGMYVVQSWLFRRLKS